MFWESVFVLSWPHVNAPHQPADSIALYLGQESELRCHDAALKDHGPVTRAAPPVKSEASSQTRWVYTGVQHTLST